MAKRFTDTALNRQPWFRKLKPKMKCAVRFLFDECDNAGVWIIDMETLSYFVGDEVSLEELFERVNSDKENRIEKFGKDKIFIPGFIQFQYGELSENCKPHKPIIQLLKKYNLYERVLKGFQKGIDTLEEKDQEKEKEKEKDFGKFENLYDESALVPQMATVFKEENKNYTQDQSYDFPALKQIAHFICKQSGISFQPRDGGVQKIVLDNWRIMSTWISNDSHYSRLNLQQIHKYIQSISTEIRNESSGSKTQSKRSTKATSTGLHEVFAERYGKREA